MRRFLLSEDQTTQQDAKVQKAVRTISQILSAKLTIMREGVVKGSVVFETDRPADSGIIESIQSEASDAGYTLLIRAGPSPNTLSFVVLDKMVPVATDIRWNIGLFAATAATIFVAGFFSYSGNPFVNAFEYLATLLAILVTHEASHYMLSKRHRIAASLPYFIPSVPPIGTFGAVIRAREPFRTRNQLFDIGLSGPLGGFLVAIIATIVGVLTSPAITPQVAASSGTQSLPFTPLFMYLVSYLVVPANMVLVLNPVAFAAWVGLLVTFLNALPTSQLDGGHVLRAFTSSSVHRNVSLGVALTMILAGVLIEPAFLLMGFLMLFLSIAGHPGALNDYSRPTRSRKLMLLVWVALLVLSAPL
jgi:Zn-dependent protease